MHTTVNVGSGDDDETDATSVGGTGDPSGSDDDPPNFRAMFEITLGQVVTTDEETGRKLIQWKAKCEGESAISDDPMAAVMGAIEGQPMDAPPQHDYGVTD